MTGVAAEIGDRLATPFAFGACTGVTMKNSTYSCRSQMVSTVKHHRRRSWLLAGVETPARLW
jgi:hypothetical protein